MKKSFLFFVVLSIFTTVVVYSCSSSENEEPESRDRVIPFAKYSQKVLANKSLLLDLAAANQSLTRTVTEEAFEALQEELQSEAEMFLEELGFVSDDYAELFGEEMSIDDKQKASVALLLYATALDQYNYSETEVSEAEMSVFIDCFLQATDITAAIGIVTGLAAGTMSKAILKQAVKILAKAGGRTLSGIGLAFVVAEMAYCMATADEEPQPAPDEAPDLPKIPEAPYDNDYL